MTSSPLSALPPLELALKPDAAEARERLRAYSQGELVDRPCASLRAPKDGARVPRRSLIVAEDARRALDEVDAWYPSLRKTICRTGEMDRRESTSWLDIWSEARTQAVQCDFCCMISREHFRKFPLPSLEYERSCLDQAAYPMGGQIRHRDDLLALRRLHTIQWVRDAGQLPALAWVEILHRIPKAGKSVQVPGSAEELKALYRKLEPQKTFYWVQNCSGGSEARELSRWMRAHT
jgi:hypothetical protein